MQVIELIKPLLTELLNEVENTPEHKMYPRRRREIYDAIINYSGQKSLQLLAVITAKKALPIIQIRYPDDNLPGELLKTAIMAINGQVETMRIKEMIDIGYHASGNAWGHDEREIPWPVWLAGNASYHALMEVAGSQPLRYLPEHYKGNLLLEWTDEELCGLAFTDTAAVVAIASASDIRGESFDSQKLLEFWKWWLNEAIPEAILTSEKE